MQTAVKKVYKAEILHSLLSTKVQVEKLLFDAETNTSWQVFHQHTQTAVNHLNNVIRLLAEQHITINALPLRAYNLIVSFFLSLFFVQNFLVFFFFISILFLFFLIFFLVYIGLSFFCMLSLSITL